jgi:hypothetical protein
MELRKTIILIEHEEQKPEPLTRVLALFGRGVPLWAFVINHAFEYSAIVLL